MRRWLASLSALCLAATAVGQSGGGLEIGYDDGTTETSWKISGPSGPSDWFNVDFNSDANGTACYISTDWFENAGIPGQRQNYGIYNESGSFANSPDINSPIVTVNPTIPAGDTLGTFINYSIPDTVLSGPVHMATQDVPGDSHTWLGSDTDGPFGGRSYFSSTAYSLGGTPFTLNWMMRIGLCPPGDPNGCIFVNGEVGPVNLEQLRDTFCLTFWGSTVGNVQFLLYLCFGGAPFFKIGLPFTFTNTGFPFLPGPRPEAWTICTTVTCDFPTTTTLEFCTIYEDKDDLKPSGKPKLKISKSASVHFIANPNCVTATGCYGQKDDGIVDFNIWKVQNPAGPSDWFNVNNGTADSSLISCAVTGLEIASWDFCNVGPCWAEVGEYNANLAVDATGATPNLNSPISTIGSATACMAPGSADSAAPYTFYDLPDFHINNSTTIYHAAVGWPAGDSCIWLGSDTDGTDTTQCARQIPNSGTDSLWTLDGYATPGMRFSGANWCIRTKWSCP
jgi:hypothetical protein